MGLVRRDRVLLAFAVGLTLEGCRGGSVDYDNLACAGGECLAGYVCHPQLDLCVPEIAIGCVDGDDACPASIQVGDSCPAQGSFVPCAGGTSACERGCRTCLATGGWSICSSGDCRTDRDGDAVVDCIDNCASVPNAVQEDADRDSRGDVCDAMVNTHNFVVSDTQVTSGGSVAGSTAFTLRGAIGSPATSTGARPAGSQYGLVEGYVRYSLPSAP